MKKFWLILGMLTCIFTMAACSLSETTEKASFEYDESALISTTEQYFDSWNTTNFSQFLQEEYVSQLNGVMISTYESWIELQNELGSFDSIIDKSVIEKGDYVKVVLRGKYKNGQTNFTMTFDSALTITNMNVEKRPTLSEQMNDAGQIIVYAMGIIFIVLIFILGIMGVVRCIRGISGRKSSDMSEENDSKSLNSVFNSIVEKEEEELSDNLELVAVVTAAIMASLGEDAPDEGLVVRSIKRRNTKQWKNA